MVVAIGTAGCGQGHADLLRRDGLWHGVADDLQTLQAQHGRLLVQQACRERHAQNQQPLLFLRWQGLLILVEPLHADQPWLVIDDQPGQLGLCR